MSKRKDPRCPVCATQAPHEHGDGSKWSGPNGTLTLPTKSEDCGARPRRAGEPMTDAELDELDRVCAEAMGLVSPSMTWEGRCLMDPTGNIYTMPCATRNPADSLALFKWHAKEGRSPSIAGASMGYKAWLMGPVETERVPCPMVALALATREWAKAKGVAR